MLENNLKTILIILLACNGIYAADENTPPKQIRYKGKGKGKALIQYDSSDSASAYNSDDSDSTLDQLSANIKRMNLESGKQLTFAPINPITSKSKERATDEKTALAQKILVDAAKLKTLSASQSNPAIDAALEVLMQSLQGFNIHPKEPPAQALAASSSSLSNSSIKVPTSRSFETVTDPQRLYERALKLLQRRRTALAQDFLKQAADNPNDHPLAQLRLGSLYLSQNKLDLAANYLTLAADKHNLAEAQYRLAAVYIQKSNMDLAEKHLKLAINKHGHLLAIRRLTNLFQLQGRIPELVALNKKFADHNNIFACFTLLYYYKCDQVSLSRGQIQNYIKQIKQNKAISTEYQKHDPARWAFTQELIMQYKSGAALRSRSEHNTPAYPILSTESTDLQSQKYSQAAEKAFKTACTHLKMDNQELAKTHFMIAATKPHNHPEAMFCLGTFYLQKYDFYHAEQLLKRAAEQLHHPRAMHNLATLYEQQGEQKKAIAYYKKAAHLNNPYACIKLLYLHSCDKIKLSSAELQKYAMQARKNQQALTTYYSNNREQWTTAMNLALRLTHGVRASSSSSSDENIRTQTPINRPNHTGLPLDTAPTTRPALVQVPIVRTGTTEDRGSTPPKTKARSSSASKTREDSKAMKRGRKRSEPSTSITPAHITIDATSEPSSSSAAAPIIETPTTIQDTQRHERAKRQRRPMPRTIPSESKGATSPHASSAQPKIDQTQERSQKKSEPADTTPTKTKHSRKRDRPGTDIAPPVHTIAASSSELSSSSAAAPIVQSSTETVKIRKNEQTKRQRKATTQPMPISSPQFLPQPSASLHQSSTTQPHQQRQSEQTERSVFDKKNSAKPTKTASKKDKSKSLSSKHSRQKGKRKASKRGALSRL